jgi:hypothetical protein
MVEIEPGKTYCVTVDNVRFQVTALRPSAIKGWWLCETQRLRERIMLPQRVLSPPEGEKPG